VSEYVYVQLTVSHSVSVHDIDKLVALGADLSVLIHVVGIVGDAGFHDASNISNHVDACISTVSSHVGVHVTSMFTLITSSHQTKDVFHVFVIDVRVVSVAAHPF